MSDNITAAASPEDYDPSKHSPAEREILLLKLLQTLAPEAKAKFVGLADMGNNRPYYNEKTAMEILPIVDGMIEDKIERCFPYQTFLENNGWTENTLYLNVQQSIDWLKDHYDPNSDGKYSKFRDEIKITKRKNDVGVRLIWRDYVKKHGPKGMFVGVIKAEPEHMEPTAWKSDLIAWMSNPNDKPVFKREGLVLSPEDQDYVRMLLEGSAQQFFIVKLEPDAIKLGRKE